MVIGQNDKEQGKKEYSYEVRIRERERDTVKKIKQRSGTRGHSVENIITLFAGAFEYRPMSMDNYIKIW